MKRTLITGGASGLGKALAEEIGKEEVITIGHRCDIEADFNNMKELQEALTKIPGDVREVIHCVGINRLSSNTDLLWTDIGKAIRVNAISNFEVNKFLLAKRKVDVICHIVSDAAHKPMTHSLAYNMSKAAQLMLVRQMAREHKPAPVIFAVSPGKIAGTPMSDYIDKTFPAMRGMTPEEGRIYGLKGLQTEEISLKLITGFIIGLLAMAKPSFHGHNFPIGG